MRTAADQTYVAMREALIPAAETYADKKAGPQPPAKSGDRYKWCVAWNAAFHRRIDELVAAARTA